jgi:hypothetical protein
MEAKIQLLLASYSLEEILEECDVTPEFVLEWLHKRGTIDLEDFFDELEEEDEY